MSERRQDRRAPRAALLCSAAFFALCAAGTALRPLGLWPMLLACAAGACVLAAVLVLFPRGGWQGALAFGLVLGLACVWSHGLLRLRPALALDGHSGLCTVSVSEPAAGYGGYGVVWGRLLSVDGQPAGHKVKLYLRDGSPDHQPGDLLALEGLVSAASSELGAGLSQRGVFLTVRQTGALSCTENGAATAVTRLRRVAGDIRARVFSLLPEREGGLLAAMLTGEGCTDALSRALAACGLLHITAVSGLHLSILAGFLVRALGRRAGAWCALPAVFLYAALAGFPASAVRAAIMQGFVLFAFLLRRENDSATALGLSGLLLCAIEPGASLSAGLLLSFSATAGILWAAPALSGRLLAHRPRGRVRGALWRYLAGTVAVSAAATAFTLPVTLVYFGTMPLLGLPMNLLCLWAVSLSLLLGIGVLLLCALFPAAAGVASAVLYVLLRVITAVVEWAGALPWATAQAGLYTALLSAVLLLALAFARARRGGRGALALCAGLLCLLLTFSAAERRLVTRVCVGDAGGGAIVALRSGGQTAFLGCGAGDYPAGNFIRREMARAGSGESAFLLAGTGWRQLGGVREALSASAARVLLVPEGSFPQTDDSAPLLWYSEEGTLSLGGLTVALLDAGESCAVAVCGPGVGLLSLCGTEPWEAVAALSPRALEASALLIDERWASSPAALSTLCRQTGASVLLLADGGFSVPPQTLCGLPVLALSERGEVTLETARK